MREIVAYCGLTCTDCPAYIATQAEDPEALERVVIQWREEFDSPGLTVELVRCDGCLGTLGHKMAHCFECEVRACALRRGIETCAHCAGYACETLQSFLGMVPAARARLDGIHAALGH
jgi:hypothetical protein